jgi:hypothetical protein
LGGHTLTWRALRAMAEHRLGRADSARDWLEKARATLATRPRPERGQSYDAGWMYWLEGELLLREAEALIEGKPGGGEKK